MKLKDFLAQFNGLDPEIEVTFRENDHWIYKSPIYPYYKMWIKSEDLNAKPGILLNGVHYPCNVFNTEVLVIG